MYVFLPILHHPEPCLQAVGGIQIEFSKYIKPAADPVGSSLLPRAQPVLAELTSPCGTGEPDGLPSVVPFKPSCRRNKPIALCGTAAPGLTIPAARFKVNCRRSEPIRISCATESTTGQVSPRSSVLVNTIPSKANYLAASKKIQIQGRSGFRPDLARHTSLCFIVWSV